MTGTMTGDSNSNKQLRVNVSACRGDFALNMDISIQASGVTAIFGKSGAGKSSLLRVIAGLDRLSDTCVQFGNEIWQNANDAWVPAHKRQVGYVFQTPSLFEHMDVAGNLEYARKRAQVDGLSFEDLSRLGIDELLDRDVSSLSGGEKQRVTIARALISSPKILLMDEPVSALDARSKEEVLSLIQGVNKNTGIPIIYVSHSLDEVARLSDQILLISDGQCVEQGATMDMMLHPEIVLDKTTAPETIIDADVVELDRGYGLCRLTFAGGDLWIANEHLVLGDKARARIMSRDLSLTLEHQENTSIQNIVAAQIAQIREPVGAQVVIELDAGGCRLLAQLTRRSCDKLGLTVGKKVYAQIKSLALLS